VRRILRAAGRPLLRRSVEIDFHRRVRKHRGSDVAPP
jgi:hypothetical protein